MFVATIIVSVVLACLLVYSAYIKLTSGGYLRVGVPADKLGYLAVLLLAGAAGLIVGLVRRPVGIAAAAGLVCYFALAIAAHLRVGDARSLLAPVTMAVLAVIALVLFGNLG